jgi:F0F1-type ATP synthase membrane subunit b/b'
MRTNHGSPTLSEIRKLIQHGYCYSESMMQAAQQEQQAERKELIRRLRATLGYLSRNDLNQCQIESLMRTARQLKEKIMIPERGGE